MATVSKLMVPFVETVEDTVCRHETHIVGTRNSSQLLNQLMNCVYEGKEGGTYSLVHTDVDEPNQEAPGELVRNPHSLPSLFK